MYRLFIVCIFLPFYSFCQNGSLELDGAITIGQSSGDTKKGVIKWSGDDFLSWNGLNWVSLTENAKKKYDDGSRWKYLQHHYYTG